MIDMDAVTLARWQFGLTATFHFLFVPLTLGLSVLLGIMESVYVMTGRAIWREMTKFWGILFGINFALGVATGITMEFQFGTNWAYYSHYVGDVFGAPLAIEGLMAFFLEATFVGLFFFGWDRLSKLGHLFCTWMVALGSSLSALWILIANGWMQNPVGAAFNFETMRMEMTSFWDLLFNPVAQSKFVHTISAGYVTGAVFVLGVSAFYMLAGRHMEFAKRSATVAASFGLASALSVVVLGDESGYTAAENQQMKIAAIEAMWETEQAPAGFTVYGIPNMETHENDDAIVIPWALGLIATRSFTEQVPGIKDLVIENQERIRNGIPAYLALEKLRKDRTDAEARATLEAHVHDLGYALLLRRYTNDLATATPAMIEAAAWDTVPSVPILFWTFRIMVGLGFFFILLFGIAFLLASARKIDQNRMFLRLCVISLPLPYFAAEIGWFVAEHGRQPWAIDGVLPTFLAASSLPATDVALSLGGFILFYSTLAILDVFLLVKYIRLGPGGKHGPATPAHADKALVGAD